MPFLSSKPHPVHHLHNMSKHDSMSSIRDHIDMPPEYNEASQRPTQPGLLNNIFACISLNMSDRIRFIRFPEDLVRQLLMVIQNHWDKGIQSSRTYGLSHEIKLKGNPWGSTNWDREKMAARSLTSKLLSELYNNGWLLKASVEMSQRKRDKDSLLFRLQHPPPPPCEWISISFMSSDRLYILDAPQELCDATIQTLGPMVQRRQDAKRSFEIKLSGRPWLPSGEEAVTTRVIALSLLEVLEKHGFRLYAAIGQDNGLEGEETDTWHCCRLKGWQPGQQVYHS